jgi:uncharacterized protein (TIGR02757 family)
MTTADSLKVFLDQKAKYYNQPSFIESDPVSIPHLFSLKQDIEISGFFAAVFAWGQRKTIINKSRALLAIMDNAPYDFVLNHNDKDLKAIENFKHRTFNATDALYFIHFLKYYYSENESLEDLFLVNDTKDPVENGLIQFHESFFSLSDAPSRTRKHIPSPKRNSTCKRLNMYLRWMVRKDQAGVDFGIWKKIKMKDLICPIDVHVDRIARRLSLIRRKQTDWLTAVELTENLKKLDPEDPVRYDYALFGLGVIEKNTYQGIL